MNIQFDPDTLRVSMQMWREAVDLTIPMRDDLKIHFMENRRPILASYAATSRSWATVLHSMTPAPEDKAEFDQLRLEVDDFGAWAQRELDELTKL